MGKIGDSVTRKKESIPTQNQSNGKDEKTKVDFMKILSSTSGSITAEFYTGVLAGKTYRMGGERLCDGGFWVHPPTIKREGLNTRATEQEVIELRKAFKKYYEIRGFRVEF